ncbi:MAG: hypothetical protein RMM98_13070 [Acidobacteriota bacterium]|nr:hypothetical protein [Blastocatellia bacterium]MDW8240537.1 hypothetical protein [Acidobacteriota bacterium]
MEETSLLGGLLVFLGLLLLGSVALAARQLSYQAFEFELRLFFVAFVLRFAMSLMIYQFGLVEVLKDEDASGWWRGHDLYRAWTAQGLGLFDLPAAMAQAFDFGVGRNRGYFYMLGGFFYLTGIATRMAAAALNGFFGALTVVLVYRIARSLASDWVAVRVGWWSCFFPSLIIWSAQTIKEPVIIFLQTLALYACVQLKREHISPTYIGLCIAAGVLLIPFRFYAAYVVIVAVLVTLLLPRINEGKLTISTGLILAVLLGGLVSVTGILSLQEAELQRRGYDLRYVEKFRYHASAGRLGTGSGVKSDFDLETPTGFVMGAAFGGVHLLLAPFPWQFGGGSVRMMLTAPEMVVWWWLFFVGVLPGLWYVVRHRWPEVLPLLIFVAGLGLLCSIAFGNIGLAYRQRAQLLPWLLIFAMVGLEQRARRRLAAQQQALAGRQVLPGTVYSTQLRR